MSRHSISNLSLKRILRADIKLHPYNRMVLALELNERNHINSRIVSAKILKQIPADAIILNSEEAHFHLCGGVKQHNFRYWSNPCTIQELPLHSPRVAVWCAIVEFGVISPYFFKEGDATATATMWPEWRGIFFLDI
ncbi:hypothetical protein Trydic_g9709 [Trypoxylus dichotomus]